MIYSSDIRNRKTSKNIGNNISVDYDVTNITGNPIRAIDGIIRKNGERVGRLSLDTLGNTAHIGLEKFSAMTNQERIDVMSAISTHIAEILTAPIEE